MATSNLRWCLAAALLAAQAITTAAQSSTGSGIPSCGSKLTGCAAYLNATTPPPNSCCDPLKEALTNEKDCLCGLYNNPDFLKALGVNITQAMNLPKLCKITTGQSSNFCQGSAQAPSSSGSGSPGGGSGSSSGSENAADKLTGTALVSSILLIVGTLCLFFY